MLSDIDNWLPALITPPIIASAVSALYLLDGMHAAVGALLNSLEEAHTNWYSK